MIIMFEIGEKVYHKNLKKTGILMDMTIWMNLPVMFYLSVSLEFMRIIAEYLLIN